MINLSKIIFEKGKHRLYPQIHSLVTLVACIGSAAELHSGGTGRFIPGNVVVVESNQFPLQINLPLHGVLDAAIMGREADAIEIDIVPKTAAPSHREETDGFKKVLLSHIMSPLFTDYFENHRTWLDDNVSTDPYQWPPAWNFGRVIRNSAAHGGVITWRLNKQNRPSPPVAWHQLTYSYADNGHKAIGTDLSLGDLLILMLEMDNELNQHGCQI